MRMETLESRMQAANQDRTEKESGVGATPPNGLRLKLIGAAGASGQNPRAAAD
jgi:hypothetical protein